MIGKAKWFKRRKYGGWGISPKTKEGIIYLIVVLGIFVIFQALPFWQTKTRLIFTGFWILFLGIDVSHIMISLNRDELETKIEAISERNALWGVVLVLVIGILYQIISSALNNSLYIDPFLAIALFVGLIIKTISNIVLEKKGI